MGPESRHLARSSPRDQLGVSILVQEGVALAPPQLPDLGPTGSAPLAEGHDLANARRADAVRGPTLEAPRAAPRAQRLDEVADHSDLEASVAVDPHHHGASHFFAGFRARRFGFGSTLSNTSLSPNAKRILRMVTARVLGECSARDTLDGWIPVRRASSSAVRPDAASAADRSAPMSHGSGGGFRNAATLRHATYERKRPAQAATFFLARVDF